MILAPMAGVSDRAFRHIAMEFGADYGYCEMISANALSFDSKNTYDLLKMADNEKGLYVQIFGSDPVLMGEMANKLCEMYKATLKAIDINMGCPMKKIIKCGSGAALMKDSKRAAQIITNVIDNSTVDVTVKCRKGFDEDNAVDFAKMIEDNGAKSVCVHARTATQLYSGKSDLDVIARVKKNVSIPVVGNGDVFTYKDAVHMKEVTNCDNVLVARGAMGNPFIFAKKDDISTQEKILTAKRHLELACHYKEEKVALFQMRKHIAWYINSIYGSAKVRKSINESKTKVEILKILDNYFNYIMDI